MFTLKYMYLRNLIKVATIYFVRAGTRCRTTRYQMVVALGPIRPRSSFYCFVPVQHRDVWGTEISIWLGWMYHFAIHFSIRRNNNVYNSMISSSQVLPLNWFPSSPLHHIHCVKNESHHITTVSSATSFLSFPIFTHTIVFSYGWNMSQIWRICRKAVGIIRVIFVCPFEWRLNENVD